MKEKERGELTISIPIGDWEAEYQESNIAIKSDDDLITAQTEYGYGPLRLARIAIVGREQAASPDDILSPNKLLLNVGAATEISGKFAQRRVAVEVNGKTFTAREFVAPVREQEADEGDSDEALPDVAEVAFDPRFVSVHSGEGMARAEKYLLERVPGYIWGRLLIIAANGGDVSSLADLLKEKVDDMVTRLG